MTPGTTIPPCFGAFGRNPQRCKNCVVRRQCYAFTLTKDEIERQRLMHEAIVAAVKAKSKTRVRT